MSLFEQMTHTYPSLIVVSLRPSMAVAIGMLVNAIITDVAFAQVQFQRAAAKVDVSEEEVARQVKEATQPLYECLPLELGFAAAVCELNTQQAAALEADGRQAIERLAEEIATCMRKYQRFNRIQIIVRASGAPAVVPWGGAAPPSDRAQLITRRVLSEAVRMRAPEGDLQVQVNAWRDAADKLAEEEHRLEKLRAQAGAMATVAALDETLRLTPEQRAQLSERFARYISDRSSNALLFITAGQREWLYMSLAGGSLIASRMPAADWQRILSAPQLAVYNETLTPQQRVAIVVEQEALIARQEALIVRQNTLGQLQVRQKLRIHQEQEAARIAKREALVAQQEAAGQLRVGQKLQVKQLRLQEREFQRGPGSNADDLLRRQRVYLQQRMEEIEAVCPLQEEQRAKLLMAGKLDLERLRSELPPPEILAEGKKVAVQNIPVDSLFIDERSYFTKALKGRLSDDQKQKLATAAAERCAFRRQALVEATVAGFERTAAITSQEWERLSAALNDLGPQDQSGENDRSDWHEDVTRLSRLPEEWWRPFFFDFQWPHAQERQAQLADVIRDVERLQQQHGPAQQQGRAAPMIGGGMF